MCNRLITIAGLILFITGCATEYMSPQGTDIARLRIYVPQNEFFASVRIMGYSTGQCEKPMSIGMIGGMAGLSNYQTLNMPYIEKYAPDSYMERLIPAAQTYLMSLRGFYPGRTCTVTASFLPKVNSDYEAVFVWDSGQCYLNIGELSQGSDGVLTRVNEPTVKQETTCKKGFT